MSKRVISLVVLAMISVNSIALPVKANENKSNKRVEVTKPELAIPEKIEDTGIESKEIKDKRLSIEDLKTRNLLRAKVHNTNITLGKANKLSINRNNSYDEFHGKFSVTSKGIVTINLKRINNYSTNNYIVKLISNDGKETYLEGFDDGTNVTYKVPVKAGTYKATFYPKFIGPSSGFTESQYTVSFNKNNNCETENNDTIKTANPIELNKEYDGIGNEGIFIDDDYFKFTTNRNGNVVLRVRCDTTKEYLGATIYDINERLYDIELGESMKKKKDYKGTYYEYTFENVKKGTYYLESIFLSGKVPYKIEVSQGISDNNIFNDIAGHFAEESILDFVKNGYTKGYDDGTFRPNRDITRAEFIKFTNKVFGYKAMVNSENFSDVNPNDWFYNEVKIALKAGYITNKNTKFRPQDPITREEVASIITSIKKNKDTNLDKLNKYTDKNKVSDWAKSSVEGAIEAGYMGKNSTTFRPKDNITRGEAVVTLYRAK